MLIVECSTVVHWEPCGKHCIWGASDLEQVMPALLGLVLRA